MNKIQKAIEDTKIELKRLRNNKICIDAKIEALEEQLEVLDSINRNHQVPHSILLVTKEEIIKKRWDAFDEVKKSGMYEDEDSSAYCDGFTKGALWIQEQFK